MTKKNTSMVQITTERMRCHQDNSCSCCSSSNDRGRLTATPTPTRMFRRRRRLYGSSNTTAKITLLLLNLLVVVLVIMMCFYFKMTKAFHHHHHHHHHRHHSFPRRDLKIKQPHNAQQQTQTSLNLFRPDWMRRAGRIEEKRKERKQIYNSLHKRQNELGIMRPLPITSIISNYNNTNITNTNANTNTTTTNNTTAMKPAK